jgi:hypothetical protein
MITAHRSALRLSLSAPLPSGLFFRHDLCPVLPEKFIRDDPHCLDKFRGRSLTVDACPMHPRQSCGWSDGHPMPVRFQEAPLSLAPFWRNVKFY